MIVYTAGVRSGTLRGLLSVVGVLLLACPATAEQVAWKIDRAHSNVGFKVRHMGVSWVRGQFDDFRGEVTADASTGRISKVVGLVKTGSVNTGIANRDAHLRQPDFFASEQFPEMKIVTRKIDWSGNTFTSRVDLTIRDQTRPVLVEGEFHGARLLDMGRGPTWRAGYTVRATIDRQQFGLRFNRIVEGISVVGNEVAIELEIELTRQPTENLTVTE